MKLNIGENIRQNRRRLDMTQEQLADRLGVTFQSVSRWECGATYPDMELLPAIARIFGITTDALLDCPNEQTERAFGILSNRYHTACRKNNSEELIEILTELRRDFDLYKSYSFFYIFHHSHVYHVYRLEGVVKELAALNRLVQEKHEDKWTCYNAIITMSVMVEDGELEDFLKEYASESDLSRDALLMRRYSSRGENEKLNPLRQVKLWCMMDDLCSDVTLFRNPAKAPDLAYSKWINGITLRYLHDFCNVTPDSKHPISGDGKPDIFAETRLIMGLRNAAYHAATGECEEAFAALEDTVSLLEAIMALPDKCELTCTSPALEGFTLEGEMHWLKDSTGENSEELLFSLTENHTNSGWSSWIKPRLCFNILTAPHGWEWLDPIREDARYAVLVERVRALIQTRPAESNA